MPREEERQGAREGRGWRRLGLLALGVVALSTAAILIRLADAPPLVAGAWRVVLAAIILAPWGVPQARRAWPMLKGREMLAVVLAGLALAVHFAAWITSLTLTTVASSVIIVTSTPIYVALVSHFLLGRRVSRRQAWAIVMAVVGGVLVGYGDLAVSGQALLGDLLALLGAWATAAYLLLGRAARARLSTMAYVWPCYGVAGALLLALCALTGQPLVGYGPATIAALVLLALLPQAIGHSTVNWALGHLSPILVTVIILGEPIGATLLAFVILREVPRATALVGGPLILAGIALVAAEQAAPGAAKPIAEGA